MRSSVEWAGEREQGVLRGVREEPREEREGDEKEAGDPNHADVGNASLWRQRTRP